MKLKGKGFILRPVKLTDAQRYFECEIDPVSMKNSMSTSISVKVIEIIIQKELNGLKSKKPLEETFVVEVKGEFAGYVVVHDLNKNMQSIKQLLVIVCIQNLEGMGFMVKAVKLVTQYVFKKYKLKRLRL